MNGSKILAKGALVGMIVGAASAASLQAAHADDTLGDPLAGSDTAIILGGTTEPTPSTAFAHAAENLYLHPLGFDDGATGSTVCDMIVTDPCAAPLQVLTTPELIQQGPSSLTAADDVTLAVENEFNATPDAFSPDHPLTIFGYSQSATAESIAMTQINDYSMAHDDSIPLDDLHFVFIGDPSLENTGVWALNPEGVPNLEADLASLFRTDGMEKAAHILTALDFDQVLGNETPTDLYPTTIYTLDTDGVADFQEDFGSGGVHGVLSDISHLFLQHVEYLGLSAGRDR